MTAAAGVSVVRFGRVQVEMLECVYQHRLLSTAQLHALYRDGLALRRTQRALAGMERVGWLASVRAPGGMKLWFVTAAGAEAVEAIGNRAELRRKVIPVEQAAGPLQQHTLAVNEVGVAFVRAARERGDECGPLSWRNEIAHPIGRRPGGRGQELLIADATLSYLQNLPGGAGTYYYRFLELDRATMAVETLAVKLGRYLRLYDYRGPSSRSVRHSTRLWEEHYPVFPSVMVVLANGTRERLERRRRLLLRFWRHDHRDARTAVHVCLLEDLIEHGPFAPIFHSSLADGPVDWLGNPPPEPEEPAPEGTEDEPEPEPPEDPEPEPPEPAGHDADPAPWPPADGYDDAPPVDDRRDSADDGPLAASLRMDRARLRDPWRRP